MDGRTNDELGDNSKYVSGAEIRKRFKLSNWTLHRWANDGRVATVRMCGQGKRLYREDDLDKVIDGFKVRAEKELGHTRAKVCYARVSSQKQKEDLGRQIDFLREKYPGHEIVRDVGSGINWKRPGFGGLLDRVMRGDVAEVVVSHRDRLCRFAFELVQRVFKNAGCRLVVHDEMSRERAGGKYLGELGTAETELRDDLLAIVTVFVASNNGRRAAAHRRARKKDEEEREKTEEASDEANEDGDEDERDGDEVPEVPDIPNDTATRDAETVGRRDEVGVQQGGGETEREPRRTGDDAETPRVGGDGEGCVGGSREDPRAVLGSAIRDPGFSAARHRGRLCNPQSQGEGIEEGSQVPTTKRRRLVGDPESATTQLQDGQRRRVAGVVRHGK